MSHELDPQREPILQAMMNVEVPSVMAEPDLKMRNATRIPLSDLSALGVAFQPLSAAIQTAVNGSGGSGIYFVNTMGKQMFHAGGSTEYIGALKSSTVRIPPPTVNGINTHFATSRTISITVPRPSEDAVISRNTILKKSLIPYSRHRKKFCNFWRKKDAQRFRAI